MDRDASKPYIARDTREELVVMGHYRVNQDGGLLRETLLPSSGDYGSDPLGNGMFRMVPSGDIVDFTERNKRLKK